MPKNSEHKLQEDDAFDEALTSAKTNNGNDESTTLATVKQLLAMPKYGWATNSYIRHLIFNAEDKIGSSGCMVPGNGLAPAILRINGKVLIDLNEFDRWLEGHRMAPTKVA